MRLYDEEPTTEQSVRVLLLLLKASLTFAGKRAMPEMVLIVWKDLCKEGGNYARMFCRVFRKKAFDANFSNLQFLLLKRPINHLFIAFVCF